MMDEELKKSLKIAAAAAGAMSTYKLSLLKKGWKPPIYELAVTRNNICSFIRRSGDDLLEQEILAVVPEHPGVMEFPVYFLFKDSAGHAEAVILPAPGTEIMPIGRSPKGVQ